MAQRRRQRLEQRLGDLVRERLWRAFRREVPESDWAGAIEALADRHETPHQAAERLAARLLAARV